MSEPDWHRPHPLTIAVGVLTFVTNNAFPIILVVAAGSAGAGLELVGIVAGLGTVAFGVGQWYVTRYAVTDTAVEYRTGILNRQARAIPLDRIQQVAVAQPLVARAFGLASVQVSEASADGDVAISYLGLDRATALTETLRTIARARDATAVSADGVSPDGVSADGVSADGVSADGVSADGVSADGAPTPPLPPPAYPIHVGDTGDLVRYQLAVSAPGIGVGLLLIVVLGVSVGIAAGAVTAVVAVLVGLGNVAVIAATGIIGPVLTLGGFELVRTDRGLTVDMGLLTRRHLEVRPDRIQTVTVTSGPIARRLDLHQVAFSAAVGKAAPENRVNHLGPAVRTEAVDELLQRSLDLESGFRALLEPVSPLTIRRFLVRSGLAYLVVGLPAAVVLTVTAHPGVAVVLTVAWFGAAVLWARARYRRLGVAAQDGRVVMRSGVLVHRLTQLSVVNVQSVVMRASFFQRRLGVADLIVSTAGIGPGHVVRVPDLPVARADALARELGRAGAESRWELGR